MRVLLGPLLAVLLVGVLLRSPVEGGLVRAGSAEGRPEPAEVSAPELAAADGTFEAQGPCLLVRARRTGDVVSAARAYETQARAELPEGFGWTVTRFRALPERQCSVAAEHLADLSVFGTDDEREWAATALREAPSELREEAEAALALRKAKPAEPPSEDEIAEQRGLRIRVDLRLFETEDNFMRDVGMDARVPRPPQMRSSVAVVDDTQCDVILHALERGRRCKPTDARTLRPTWKRETVDLAGHCVLGLEAAGSSNRKWIGMTLALRTSDGDAARFVPFFAVTLPDRGTLLLQPADALSPDAPAGRRQYLLLIAEFEELDAGESAAPDLELSPNRPPAEATED